MKTCLPLSLFPSVSCLCCFLFLDVWLFLKSQIYVHMGRPTVHLHVYLCLTLSGSLLGKQPDGAVENNQNKGKSLGCACVFVKLGADVGCTYSISCCSAEEIVKVLCVCVFFSQEAGWGCCHGDATPEECRGRGGGR